MRERLPVPVLVVLIALGLVAGPAGCGGDEDDDLLVFAAASLTDVFEEIIDAYEGADPGVAVQLNPGGSSALREQILAGAPADVFAAADPVHTDRLEAAGELAAPARVFARNELVVAVPAGNPAGVTGADALADRSLLVGLCAVGVPCGDLARAALTEIGIEPAVDTDEPDVRALLTKIGAGELDVGIVYRTDIAADDRVEAIPLPAEVTTRAVYPIAVTAGSDRSGTARGFVDFVLSEEGRRILADHGFLAP